MSKSKGFSDTSASRYSLALYELASETNILKNFIETCSIKRGELKAELISAKDLTENEVNNIKDELTKNFSSLIKDPTNKKEDQLNSILKISQQFKLNELLTKFLSFLISKRRFFYVERILKDFIETCSKKRGEIKAELTAAKKLTQDEINDIKEELSKNFSSKIKLNYKNDPSLIGGLVVQIGSTMVDTSIKNKLKQIKNRMIEA